VALDIEATPNEGALGVRLAGELDAHASPQLGAAIEPLLVGSGPQLVVDAGDLTFLDSSGLSELLRIRQRVDELGGSFVLASVSAQVRRVLEITDLLEEFGVR
jgi:anti-anti-sigma factor